MGEVRYNPLLDEWVIVAPHRGSRPVMPDGCPFCPGNGNPEVAGEWQVRSVANKYGALAPDGHDVVDPMLDVWKAGPATGATEVVLYTPEHEGGLHALGSDHLLALADLWVERERTLGAMAGVRYVFSFENRGAAVGVSQGHPHGQVYAFPFIPGTVRHMLDAAGRHHAAKGTCVHCDILEAEMKDGRRIIAANDHAVAYVPYAARLPFEVRLAPRRHVERLGDLARDERRGFMDLMSAVFRAQRGVYGFDMPGVMAHYPAPTDGTYPHHHYHVGFFPVQRNRDQIKFFGGVESAGGTMVNDSSPEDRAADLTAALAADEGAR